VKSYFEGQDVSSLCAGVGVFTQGGSSAAPCFARPNLSVQVGPAGFSFAAVLGFTTVK